MNYSLSNRGKAQLAGLEGMILTKYYDSVGVQTIGIGATQSDIPDLKSWPWDKKLTIEECISLFEKHVQKYVNAVNSVLKVKVGQHQFDALVSICYNIGTGIHHRNTITNARGVILSPSHKEEIYRESTNELYAGMKTSTFMRRINAGESLASIANAIMMWDIPREIIGRRRKEANLYVYGDYSEKGMVGISPVGKSSHKPLYGAAKRYNILEYLNNKQLDVKEGEKEKAPSVDSGASFWDMLKKLFWHI